MSQLMRGSKADAMTLLQIARSKLMELGERHPEEWEFILRSNLFTSTVGYRFTVLRGRAQLLAKGVSQGQLTREQAVDDLLAAGAEMGVKADEVYTNVIDALGKASVQASQ